MAANAAQKPLTRKTQTPTNPKNSNAVKPG
jgi:hypothetical protein